MNKILISITLIAIIVSINPSISFSAKDIPCNIDRMNTVDERDAKQFCAAVNKPGAEIFADECITETNCTKQVQCIYTCPPDFNNGVV